MDGVLTQDREPADAESTAAIQDGQSSRPRSQAVASEHAIDHDNLTGNSQVLGLRATKRRLWSVLFGVLATWLLTAILAGSIYAVLAVYSNKPVMSQGEKRGFNAFITGLSIALGLTIASSLDEMVGDLRWWIMSRRHRSIRKIGLIMQADRVRHLVVLATRSHRSTLHAAVWAWVCIIVASQLAVASIGLCYSTDAADRRARLVPGNVSIPNMADIQTAKIVSSKSSSFSAQQYTANSFGTVSLAFGAGEPNDIPPSGQLWFTDEPLMFCGETSCRYVFHEVSTKSILNDDESPVTVTTSRSLNASALCYSWPVTRGGDGTRENITVATDEGDIIVPIPIARGVDETMYMTNTSRKCGPGCSILYAFEASDSAPWFYQCNATVGQVVNGTLPEHRVGTNLSSLASSAIALQGYDASSLVNSTDFQYQIYPAESVFGRPANGSVEYIAFLLARFAIGVVAVAAGANDKIVIDGLTPVVGVQLNLTHGNLIIMILVLVTGLQLVLGLAVALVAHQVVVPQGGPPSFAKVFRSMAESHDDLSNRPSDLNCTAGSKSVWIYRDKQIGPGVYDLHMERKRETETKRGRAVKTNQVSIRPEVGNTPSQGTEEK